MVRGILAWLIVGSLNWSLALPDKLLCPGPGESQVVGMEYGSSVADGASGFADLVGVYGSAKTWAKVRAWSMGVGGIKEVMSSSECDLLCKKHRDTGCEVWTWKAKECWMKRSISTPPALTAVDGTVHSGAIPIKVVLLVLGLVKWPVFLSYPNGIMCTCHKICYSGYLPTTELGPIFIPHRC
jgi:hypothetical protein